MLNLTTETAIKVLIYLTIEDKSEPLSPKFLAEQLEESPSYMAKITGLLVKAGILRAHRGVSGGVTLYRKPDDVKLFDIVEACQGKILGNYCEDTDQLEHACAFHKAMYQIHEATTKIMKQWTLAELANNPVYHFSDSDNVTCKMAGVCPRTLPKSG